MNWGKWIVVTFVLFAAFIGTLVWVCVRQDISLVSKDYYKDELAYQDQIERLQNGSDLIHKPTIEVMNGNQVVVEFADFNKLTQGDLKLFRPSNPAMDKTFKLLRNSKTTQSFSTEALTKGMYRARMQWTMNGKEFFIEEVIYL
jgi:hypothetical protein